MRTTPNLQTSRRGIVVKWRLDSDEIKVDDDTEKTHQKSKNNGLKSLIAAAKRISTILFRRKKSTSKKDQYTEHSQSGQSPYSSHNSNAHDSRKSSRSRRSSHEASRSRLSSCEASREVDIVEISNLTFEEIYKATGNFSVSNKIGGGGFGTVYKAKLKNGSFVAVKRAKKEMYDQRISDQFKNEILALSKIEHLSLVRFYGFIKHEDERLIIMEYINNGNLRQHLDGTCGNGLDIAERLDIAIDIAHAITYLHNYTDPPIIHRDIKSSNILMTETLRAKVSDFGFARTTPEDFHATHISTDIKGTTGYIDPEYLKTYQLSVKSDVYSFGVLLVEMITGRNPIESKRSLDERITVKWALRSLRDGEVVIAMDQRLKRSVASVKAVEKVLKLARQCVAPSKLNRPYMRKCVEILWEIRKQFRETMNSHASSAPFHSANVIGRTTRRNGQEMFGIENSDSLMFVSA